MWMVLLDIHRQAFGTCGGLDIPLCGPCAWRSRDRACPLPHASGISWRIRRVHQSHSCFSDEPDEIKGIGVSTYDMVQILSATVWPRPVIIELPIPVYENNGDLKSIVLLILDRTLLPRVAFPLTHRCNKRNLTQSTLGEREREV
jgi:hypothetical protein